MGCWYVPYSEKGLADLKQALETVSKVTIRDNIEQCLPAEILLPEKPVVEVPSVYRETLQRLRYSQSSISNYVSQFNAFLLFIQPCDHTNFTESHVYDYLLHLVETRKVSLATQNVAINAIKFYLEHVEKGERKKYSIERPLKEFKLPTVLSEEEMQALFLHTKNLKHRCLLYMIYSAGLRISELLELKHASVDAERKLIYIKCGKGRKDRITLLSRTAYVTLQEYMARNINQLAGFLKGPMVVRIAVAV